MSNQPPIVLKSNNASRRRFTVFGIVEPNMLGVDYVSAVDHESAKDLAVSVRGKNYIVSCVLRGYAKPLYHGPSISLTPQESSYDPLGLEA